MQTGCIQSSTRTEWQTSNKPPHWLTVRLKLFLLLCYADSEARALYDHHAGLVLQGEDRLSIIFGAFTLFRRQKDALHYREVPCCRIYPPEPVWRAERKSELMNWHASEHWYDEGKNPGDQGFRTL